uniref:Uncharacterized protein n=1 Tax=Tanacetum cinerariifolium TaxID=118510 RepID=A0A6L2JFQ7_TANCI|nr:hypothetical protein [Tanacetum cinerariifolium]
MSNSSHVVDWRWSCDDGNRKIDSKDMISSCLDNIEKELQRLHEIKQDMNERRKTNIREIEAYVEKLDLSRVKAVVQGKIRMLKVQRSVEMVQKMITPLPNLLITKTKLREDILLHDFGCKAVKQILDYLHSVFKILQKEFPEDVKEIMDVFFNEK